jgi:uncharacterized membrane protein
MEYELVKWIHIISATVLFGTGLGSAFYKLMADRTGNIEMIAHTNKTVVTADWIFTTPTIIIQPLSGVVLAGMTGVSLSEPWLLLSIILFVIAGICWLPVVWLQIRMANSSQKSMRSRNPLTPEYSVYARQWFWLGIPAFAAMMTVFLLMVVKPEG